MTGAKTRGAAHEASIVVIVVIVVIGSWVHLSMYRRPPMGSNLNTYPLNVALLMFVVSVGIAGCGASRAARGGGAENSAPVDASAEAEEMAPPPATAEQIRGVWVPGLVVELRTDGKAGGEQIRVVDADEHGVEVEFATIDADGGLVGEIQRRGFQWQELASHGLFPASLTVRERSMRDTPLGTLEGWTYRVSSATGEGETELFFADSMPGMPVLTRVRQPGGEVVETAQVYRCVEQAAWSCARE